MPGVEEWVSWSVVVRAGIFEVVTTNSCFFLCTIQMQEFVS